MKKVVITSGFFNPIHIGHMNLIKEARQLGDMLVVIVNNDAQVKIKGSVSFMSQEERVAIIKDLKYVDQVFLSIDNDAAVAESLKAVVALYPGQFYFAKGGDRSSNNIPESERKVCEKFNIEIVNGVGGGKIQSSSQLLNSVIKAK